MSEKWKAFGPAVNDTIQKLIALGLPASASTEASQLVWTLGAWQGTREYRNGKIALAEQMTAIAYASEQKADGEKP